MKTHLLTLALFGFLVQNPIVAQNRTTVNATSNEISDNLDLRAVASIFGDAKDLQDFERQLNDPQNKISNLDLNFDRQVDYLRVIEAVEKNTHLIILQAVLEKDVFQDVATIEVERDRNNKVQIQVVGDVFMYGPNYIYEPVYVARPIIYNMFWVNNYSPYYSPYYYNYYPNYYYAWTPYPIYRYRRNVHIHINQYNNYNYCDNRRSSRAVAMYETRRSNGYERNNPNQAFTVRNNVKNRRELDQVNTSGRRIENNATRNYAANSNATDRNNNQLNSDRTIIGAVRSENSVRSTRDKVNILEQSTDRSGNTAIRSTTGNNPVRSLNNGEVQTTKVDRSTSIAAPSGMVRSSSIQSNSTRNNTQPQAVRTINNSSNATRNSSSSRSSAPASNASRSENSRSGGQSNRR